MYASKLNFTHHYTSIYTVIYKKEILFVNNWQPCLIWKKNTFDGTISSLFHLPFHKNLQIKKELNEYRPRITWFVTEKLKSNFQVSISYRWMGFLFLFSCYSKIDSCQLHAPCLLKNDNHAIHGNSIDFATL